MSAPRPRPTGAGPRLSQGKADAPESLIRAARPLDAGRVANILSDFVDTTGWMPRVHSRAEDLAHAGNLIARGWVRVIETAGTIRGFIARDGRVIHALYVGTGARDAGLGSALLIDAQAASDRLELWTFETNHGARRFYERHGFVTAERTDGAGNDEGLPDRRYVWHGNRRGGPLT